MAKPSGPQRPKVIQKLHYLAEHMDAQGVKPAALAEAMNTTTATISRWRNMKRGMKGPEQQRVERILKLPPGGLRRPPGDLPGEALLTGLDDEQKRQALKYIEFLRKQDE
jgi:transcriptional regulator with XRE-family HTH domain